VTRLTPFSYDTPTRHKVDRCLSQPLLPRCTVHGVVHTLPYPTLPVLPPPHLNQQRSLHPRSGVAQQLAAPKVPYAYGIHRAPHWYQLGRLVQAAPRCHIHSVPALRYNATPTRLSSGNAPWQRADLLATQYSTAPYILYLPALRYTTAIHYYGDTLRQCYGACVY
jgi:hypothetical protein